MKITELTPVIAQSAFEEFWDTWLSTWGSTRQLPDAPRTSYTYFKGYVGNEADEEDEE